MIPRRPPLKPMNLTDAEQDGLREVGKGMMQRFLEADVQDRLIELGLVAQKLGGLQLTQEGQAQFHALRR